MRCIFLLLILCYLSCGSSSKMIEQVHKNEKGEVFVFTFLVSGKDSIPEGTWYKYSSNGDLKAYITFCEGKRCRISKQYHDNGQLAVSLHHLEGLRAGTYKSFYDNGKIKCSGKFDSDKPVGNWIWYSDEGVELKSIDMEETGFKLNKEDIDEVNFDFDKGTGAG